MSNLTPVRASHVRTRGLFLSTCFVAMTLLATAVGLISPQARAADAATGTIEGRVLNQSNGRYLGKAVVQVEGSTNQTLTNDFGEYRLIEVPAGDVKLTVTYQGLEPRTHVIVVEAGKVVTKDFGLSRETKIATEEETVMVLDPYTASETRFKNAAEIAINEERQSANIKSVVSADSLGHVADGNIGEFVRFMPGIDVSYGGTYVNGADASQISVRGFGPEDTAIMIDGMPVSSPSPANLTRAVGLDMISINNASRIEVTKVSTPDMANDSPGGSVNLITRSAFEYAKPEYTAEATATFNTMDMNFLKKEPGPINKKSYHTLPGARMSVSYPLNKDLGFSFSIASDNKYQPNQSVKINKIQAGTVSNDMRAYDPSITVAATPMVNSKGVSTFANPFTDTFQIYDNPWVTYKQSGNLRVDWRPITGMSISTNYQYSQYTGNNVSRRLAFTIARPLDWGDDYITGIQYRQAVVAGTTRTTDGGAKITQTIDARDKGGDTHSGYIKMSFQRGAWSFDGFASRSLANGHYDDRENGHFSGLDLTLSNVGNLSYSGITEGHPTTITAARRDGTWYDYTKMKNWTLDNAATLDAKSGEAYQKDIADNFGLNLRRELDFLPWRSGAKIGWARAVKSQSKWGPGTGYKTRYVGTTALTAADITDDVYQVSPGFRYPIQQWADVYKLYSIAQAHPEYFDEGIIISNATGNYVSSINQKKKVTETADSFYAMYDAKFFNNRLSITTGVRQKLNKVTGYQPYTDGAYLNLKNAAGQSYYDPVWMTVVPINGSAISTVFNGYAADGVTRVNKTLTYAQWTTDAAFLSRLAQAGLALPTPYYSRNANNTGYLNGLPDATTGLPTVATPGTWQNNMDLTKIRSVTRNLSAKRTDPSTPSFIAAYKLTKNIDLKASVSRETKLPDLENSSTGGGYIAGASTSTDSNTGVTTVVVNNPNLKPEITNSLNVAVSYYNKTGSFTISGYMKQIENEWENLTYFGDTDEGLAIARAAGYEPSPSDIVKTTINGTDGISKKRGLELEVRQNLSIIGEWASGFDMFATYTYKTHSTLSAVSGVINSQQGKSQDKYSAGLMYSTKKLTLAARGTYAESTYSKNSNSPVSYTGPDGVTNKYQLYDYYDPEYRVNFEGSYRLSANVSLLVSVSDAIRSKNNRRTWDIGSDVFPEYERTWVYNRFGTTITAGVTATF